MVNVVASGRGCVVGRIRAEAPAPPANDWSSVQFAAAPHVSLLSHDPHGIHRHDPVSVGVIACETLLAPKPLKTFPDGTGSVKCAPVCVFTAACEAIDAALSPLTVIVIACVVDIRHHQDATSGVDV